MLRFEVSTSSSDIILSMYGTKYEQYGGQKKDLSK